MFAALAVFAFVAAVGERGGFLVVVMIAVVAVIVVAVVAVAVVVLATILHSAVLVRVLTRHYSPRFGDCRTYISYIYRKILHSVAQNKDILNYLLAAALASRQAKVSKI